MRIVLTIAILLVATIASAQMMLLHMGNNTAGGGPPPMCVADGKTDWSNACDLPLGVAIGVL